MRLIDADALSEAMYRKSFETDDGRQRWDGGLWIRYKVFEEARDNAPTIDAEPVTSWVTDRHPPFGENVLITFATGEIGIGDYRDFVNSPWYADGQYFGDEDIAAWMPLPRPYVGEGEKAE